MLEDMKLKDIVQVIKLLNLKYDSKNDYEIDNGRYVIIRTYSAGVFAGNLISRRGKEVILQNARRLWKWAGAASLSQLAMEGVKDPDNCMFPCEVDSINLLEAIEIIDCTDKAKESIKKVKIWEK